MEKVSPLQHVANNPIIGQAVTLADRSLIGKLQVEGDAAGEVLAAAFGMAPANNSEVSAVDGVMIGRITSTRYLLLTEKGGESAAESKINAAIGDRFISVSPQTNGQALIHVSGDGSRDLLSRLCGLDFDPAVFPVNSVKNQQPRQNSGQHLAHGKRLSAHLYALLCRIFVGNDAGGS